MSKPKGPTLFTKSTHPECFCDECGGINTQWTSDNQLFNLVNGSPNGILCPNCFIKKAHKKGISIYFEAHRYV